MLPQEIFKMEHSETLFLAFLETKYQFPSQGWSSLKFSLKSKIFNENGLLAGEGRGRNFQLFIDHCEFTFYRISKTT